MDFNKDLKLENIYNEEFLSRMKEAQIDIKKNRVKKFETEKEFLDSI
jgi:hypothetical protein